MKHSFKKYALIGAAIVGAGYVLKRMGILSFYSGPVPGADGPVVNDPEAGNGIDDEDDDEESDE